MKHVLLTSIFALAASLALANFASANETPASTSETITETQPSWTSQISYITWTGTGVKKEFRGVRMTMDSLYSGDKTTSGNVAFTCFAGALGANVALEPVALAEIIKNPKKVRNAKKKRPDIKIDGEIIDSTEWVYMTKLKVYKPRKKSTAAKIYNAVIRKSKVEMKIKQGEYVTLNLPPIDNAYKKFGAECGLGVGAQK